MQYTYNISKSPITSKSRNSTILHCFIGYTFQIYRGNKFIKVIVDPEMVGRKFGEFSPTRVVRRIHKKAKGNKKKKN